MANADDLKAGDIVECWPGDNELLVRVGVVHEPPDDNGYLTVWFISATRRGEFYSLSNGTFKLSDGKVRRLVPEPVAAAVEQKVEEASHA